MNRILLRTMMILGMTVSVTAMDLDDCKRTHSNAVQEVTLMGVQIQSSSGCGDGTGIACVSLEQINCDSLSCLRQLKNACNCTITITAGTETNNENGYKIGIALQSDINNYILSTFGRVDDVPSGPIKYMDSNLNTYTNETNRWDIRFPNYCRLQSDSVA